jgi:hypothetical protein
MSLPFLFGIAYLCCITTEPHKTKLAGCSKTFVTIYQTTRRHISEDSSLHREYLITTCGMIILCVRGWCPAGVPTLPLPPATFFTTWPVDLDAPPAGRWLVQRAGMKQCSFLRKKTFLWRGSVQAELMCCVLWDRTWPTLLPGELLALLVIWRSLVARFVFIFWPICLEQWSSLSASVCGVRKGTKSS